MFYKSDEAAEYVFNMCDKLKQPPEVKYFAVEIFNKYVSTVLLLFKSYF